MPAFKILSDFDGVWTEVDLEARALHEHLVASCAALVDRAPTEVEADFRRFAAAVAEAPGRYGWAPDGRVSAFCDEDPLCTMAGLSLYIAQAQEATAKRYREAIEQRFASMAEFSEEGFRASMRKFRREQPPSIAADAREQLAAVTAAGAEVVVCSNSEPDKLIAWFAAVGIDAGQGPDHELRIRGSAGKQVLGGSEVFECGGRKVFVDRPRYREAIIEEQPTLVIGDVFSLDLSLPHAMRASGHPCAPQTLVLRRHPHTPAWILNDRAAGAIDHVVDRFEDLAAVVHTALEA